MKSFTRTCLTASAGVLAVAAIALCAATPPQAYASGRITVTDENGKVLQSEKVSNGKVINGNLASALAVGKSSKACKKTTVKVPAGNYKISTSASWVRIFSNTNLELDKNTVLTVSSGKSSVENFQILQANHFRAGGRICGIDGTESTCKHGGYSQISNVSISGGIWDGNAKSHPKWNVSGILAQHGENLSFSKMVFRNFSNHALNIAGTREVKVSGCTFRDSVRYKGTAKRFWGSKKRNAQETIDRIRSTESVHTDFCNRTSESTAYPLDNTPCKDITVSSCTFKNTYSGVGTHHELSTPKMSGISVTGCTFTLKDGNAVNLFNCSSATVRNCKVKGGYCLVRADKATATIDHSTATSCTGNAIAGVKSSRVTISNNTVKSPKIAGILLDTKSSGTVRGNTIVNVKNGTGINISKSKATVKGNVIQKGITGISVKTPTGGCTISSNRFTGNGGNGIYIYRAQKGKTLISGNSIPSAKTACVRIVSSKNATVSKNSLGKAQFAVSVSASSNVKISNNRIRGGNSALHIVDGSKKVKVSGTKS